MGIYNFAILFLLQPKLWVNLHYRFLSAYIHCSRVERGTISDVLYQQKCALQVCVLFFCFVLFLLVCNTRLIAVADRATSTLEVPCWCHQERVIRKAASRWEGFKWLFDRVGQPGWKGKTPPPLLEATARSSNKVLQSHHFSKDVVLPHRHLKETGRRLRSLYSQRQTTYTCWQGEMWMC